MIKLKSVQWAVNNKWYLFRMSQYTRNWLHRHAYIGACKIGWVEMYINNARHWITECCWNQYNEKWLILETWMSQSTIKYFQWLVYNDNLNNWRGLICKVMWRGGWNPCSMMQRYAFEGNITVKVEFINILILIFNGVAWVEFVYM